MYVDTSKVVLRKIDKKTAKKMIVENHYSRKFSLCRHAIGIFYQEDTEHRFFEGEKEEKLIGCLTYGHPVGRSVVGSLFKEEIIDYESVLELTRLFIHDGYGKNIESYSISQSFKWLKHYDKSVKVLISYADPDRLHLGGIYKAPNWIYQGAGLNLMPNYSVSLVEEPYDWIHSRTVFARFGSHNIDKLKSAIGHTFWRRREPEKHRYIYFLGSKSENKRFKKFMKYESKDYPTNADEYLPPIEEIEVNKGITNE